MTASCFTNIAALYVHEVFLLQHQDADYLTAGAFPWAPVHDGSSYLLPLRAIATLHAPPEVSAIYQEGD